MNDLTKITADNTARRAMKEKASDGPWTIYQSIWRREDREFVRFARMDNAEDVIDALVEEIRFLRDPTYEHVPVEKEKT